MKKYVIFAALMHLLRTISTFVLCLLVFFSSSSFIIAIHLCGGNVEDIGFVVNAEGCENHKQVPPCHKQAPQGCCDDQTIVHDGHDLKPGANQHDVSPTVQVDVQQSSVVISEIIPSGHVSQLSYYNYDSPLRSSDLTVSLQVFLI